MATIKRKKEDPEARYVKGLIVNQLLKEGHRTFAKYIANPKLYLRLTDSPDIVAAISERTGEIFLNKYFTDMPAISMLIRHELLHKMFEHEKNTIKILAKQLGLDYDTLDDLTLDQLRQLAYEPTAFEGSIQNIAGDYHLSQYYTDVDRAYVKALDFYGQQIQGLLIDQLAKENPYGVTLDLSDAKKYSFEELYDLFDKAHTKLMWDAYDHEYGEYDDEGNFTEVKPSHDLYIGFNNSRVVFYTDEAPAVKQYFDKCQEWYHLTIPEYLSKELEAAANSSGDDNISNKSFDEIAKEFKDFNIEQIDSNLNVI